MYIHVCVCVFENSRLLVFFGCFQSSQSCDTPLHNASFYRHYEIVEMLLKAGANHSLVNKVTNYMN